MLGEGLDSERVRRPIPIEKALDPETLVVYEMNGVALPLDHGFPARLLVPGWVVIANIKWLGRIEASKQPIYTPWNTTSYVMVGDAYPGNPLVTTHRVKSAFELPWDATLRRGRQTVTGRAWSAFDRIRSVEVSDDGGGSGNRQHSRAKTELKPGSSGRLGSSQGRASRAWLREPSIDRETHNPRGCRSTVTATCSGLLRNIR